MSFYEYCRRTIEDFDLRFRVALQQMDRARLPLYVADYELYSDCSDALEDWCNDYDGGSDPDDYDIEELLFED